MADDKPNKQAPGSVGDHEADRPWLQWIELMRTEIVPLMKSGHFEAAIAKLEIFLSSEMRPDLRIEAIGFKAHFKEKIGDMRGAEEDLLAARSLAQAGSYGKFVNELCLGSLCEKQRRISEALSWYRFALRTCVEGRFSGGSALKSFLAVQPQNSLTEEDRALCVQAAQGSWQALGISGEPHLNDLHRVALMLIDVESAPPAGRK